MGDTKGSKPGVFRWGGILASRGRVVQTMVFVAVSVATIAFAIAQLGLVGLGEPNEGMTYAVVQLVPSRSPRSCSVRSGAPCSA